LYRLCSDTVNTGLFQDNCFTVRNMATEGVVKYAVSINNIVLPIKKNRKPYTNK